MNKYDWFVVVGLLIWLGETAFFGFNTTAQSGAEKMFDTFSQVLILYGVLCGIATGIKTQVVINNPAGVTAKPQE